DAQYASHDSVMLVSFRKQMFDETAVSLCVPVDGHRDFLANHAVLADDHRFRVTGHLICVLDLASGIVQHIECHSHVLHESANGGLCTRIVDAHSDHMQAPRSVCLVQALDARHLDPAWLAPCRPDVDQNNLALVVRERFQFGRRVERHRMKIGSSRAGAKRRELGSEGARNRESDRGHRNEHDCNYAQLSAACHASSVAAAFSSQISADGVDAEKIALPATNVSAPARRHCRIVSRATPPSTSRSASERDSSSRRRARRILSIDAGMNACPPNPGLTVMTSRRSMSSVTSRTESSEVAGLMATPARQPSDLMWDRWRWRCTVASAWIVSPVAPARAKSSKYDSGWITIR